MRLALASSLLVLGVLAVPALAAETETKATVISYDSASMKLLVKVNDTERVVQLQKDTHVHYPVDGKIREVRAKERASYLKKGVKIVIVEEDGKLVEINIEK